jgi:glyoxylase-like metal-dependent hydrolase (beta-lactamase superfamily II)
MGGGAQTTAMLLDDDILIDAGTGVSSLSMAEMCKIDHIFVTHAHLDHVACIPFLVDTSQLLSHPADYRICNTGHAGYIAQALI